MKYRKKIEKRHLKQFDGNVSRIHEFTEGASFTDANGDLMLDTLEGVQKVQINDWVVQGVSGEFYAISPTNYENSYEPIIGSLHQRKPLELEGFQYGVDRIPEWAKPAMTINLGDGTGTLKHRDELHNFKVGSYIIRNMEGNPYVCQEEEFNKSFDKLGQIWMASVFFHDEDFSIDRESVCVQADTKEEAREMIEAEFAGEKISIVYIKTKRLISSQF